MPSICFYFEVHQPFRVKRYSYFQVGRDHQYFDETKNAGLVQRIADKCYLPTNSAMLRLIERYNGAFKISYSISGVALEQFAKYAPKVLDSFIELSKTGAVEFLSETYYHSLSSLYNQEEFSRQINEHRRLIETYFGQTPTVFRNTELVYSDWIGELVHKLGFKAMLAEGADDILDWRSPNYVYKHPHNELRILPKNYRLSDDIAFRFSNQGWKEFPLTADKFASWVHRISGAGETVNLFMDYETFGEHQWASTGIFEFLDHLPAAIYRHPDWSFETPSEVLNRCQPISELAYPRITSWADVGRDLTAWIGNGMQQSALNQIYELSARVLATDDPEIISVWRKLQTSDHFYYMCTKWFADGDVHAYFSPYESPYDAFINYMNVMKDFQSHYLGLNASSQSP